MSHLRRCDDCGWDNEVGATFCANPDCLHFLTWQACDQDTGPELPPPTGTGRPPGAPPKTLAPPVEPIRPPADAPDAGEVTSSQVTTIRRQVDQPRTVRHEACFELIRPTADPVEVRRLDTIAEDPPPAGAGSSDGRQGLFLMLDRREVRAEPGGEDVITARVRNTGSLVERAVVEVVDLPPGWSRCEPAELNLDVGADAEAKVHLQPPRGPQSAAGSMSFGIVVWSATNPRVRCSEPCRLTVAPFDDVGLVVDPPSAARRGRRATTFTVTAHNRGNVAHSARLRATVADRTAVARCEPDLVELPPGATTTARLTVRPRSLFPVGSTKPHRVAVEAGSSTTRVELVQRGWVGKGVARVLLVVLLLLGVFAALAAKDALQNGDRPVPEVSALALDAATELLEEAGFDVVAEERADPTVPEGVVIAQEPRADQELAAGEPVTVFVSSGPPLVAVPNVRGLDEQGAREVLATMGLKVASRNVPADNVAPGFVVNTDPTEGQEVPAGSTVTLDLSVGP